MDAIFRSVPGALQDAERYLIIGFVVLRLERQRRLKASS